MSTFKTLAMAAALLAGASTLASAQMSGNSGSNAAVSGGSGTHATAPRTGSAANTQKVIKNHNGYQRQ